MAVKVVSDGPVEHTQTCICRKCKHKLEFESEDVAHYPNVSCGYVNCPRCHETNFVKGS